nr:uncharacterized protein LOC109771286 [Aegilops tauschii subsp. strangulata]
MTCGRHRQIWEGGQQGSTRRGMIRGRGVIYVTSFLHRRIWKPNYTWPRTVEPPRPDSQSCRPSHAPVLSFDCVGRGSRQRPPVTPLPPSAPARTGSGDSPPAVPPSLRLSPAPPLACCWLPLRASVARPAWSPAGLLLWCVPASSPASAPVWPLLAPALLRPTPSRTDRTDRLRTNAQDWYLVLALLPLLIKLWKTLMKQAIDLVLFYCTHYS